MAAVNRSAGATVFVSEEPQAIKNAVLRSDAAAFPVSDQTFQRPQHVAVETSATRLYLTT